MKIGVKHAYDKRTDWCPTVSNNILSTICALMFPTKVKQ